MILPTPRQAVAYQRTAYIAVEHQTTDTLSPTALKGMLPFTVINKTTIASITQDQAYLGARSPLDEFSVFGNVVPGLRRSPHTGQQRGAGAHAGSSA